jgi:hypothetical protein
LRRAKEAQIECMDHAGDYTRWAWPAT